MTTMLTGVCRAVMPWTDNTGQLDLAFGTHSNLQLWQGGALYDITPTKAFPPIVLGANLAGTNAANPLATTNGSPVVTVSHPGHGYTTGQSIIVSGAVAVGGITPNGTFIITVTGTDSYTFTFGSNATGTAQGGGSAVQIANQTPFAAGQIDGTGGTGIGTGAYGVGGYGQPSTADYFPRTWSLSPWGQDLVASPRSGTLYQWVATNTGAVATPVLNAPSNITYSLVAPMNGGYQTFALGCNQEASGIFNPLCIRHTSVRSLTEWNTATASTAREYVLVGGGRIVAGGMLGPNMLVWTTKSLFLGTFVGDLNQPWRFDQVGEHCGLIGPGAFVIVGQKAFWVSPDRQFHEYSLGLEPIVMSCPIREDFAENLAASQADKIVASSISEFGEVRFDYPDARDGYENSRYVAVCVAGPDAGAWYRGQMARTAMVDAGPSQYPCGVTYSGQAYWHERGHTADGGPLSWFIMSSDQYFDVNQTMLVRGVWPDITDQVGAVSLTMEVRYKPESEVRTYGPYTLALGSDRLDLRAKGRLFRMKFSGNWSPSRFRLGKPVFDAKAAGAR